MRIVLWMSAPIAALLGTVLWVPVSGHGRWFAVVLNAGHGLLFAVVAVMCKISVRSIAGVSEVRQNAAAFGIAVGLGAVVEVLQLPIGRDADLADVVRDALGAWAGLALLAFLGAKDASRRRAAVALSFIVPVCVLAMPVIDCARAYARRAADFPVLADFSRSYDDYFMESSQSLIRWVELPARWSRTPREKALRVTFVGGPYAGIDFVEPVAEWTAFRELAIDLTNPGVDSLSVVLRVHDARHNHSYEDRYNKTFVLEPQQRTILAVPLEEIRRGPRDRALDIAQVADFMLFVSMTEGSSAPTKELLLSRVWLR